MTDIINKYKGYIAIYRKSIEEHPTASGTEYLKGLSRGLELMINDIEEATEAKNARLDIAGRILNTDFYGIRDAMDEGPATPGDISGAIAEDLKDPKKCLSIITYLLDIIEEVKA